MSSENQNGIPDVKSHYTVISRVTHIPIVESSISTIHETLSKTPLIRTPYNISLAISSTLLPYVQCATNHFPFAPFLAYGDRAANKTLDIAQEKWPYPFEKKPEQVWGDVKSVADNRVIKPACNVAKSVDQSLAISDTFTSVVNKFHAGTNNVMAAEEYSLRRAYDLLRMLKDDVMRFSNEEQAAAFKNIHAALMRITEKSSELLSALRSRSEDAATRAQDLGQAVLAELEKLPPLLASFSSNASNTVKDASVNLRNVLTSDEALGEKLPKVRTIIQDTIKSVVEDIVHKGTRFTGS